MDFRVLGTLEVWEDEQRVTLPSTRHQRVLAALLLTPNAVVPLPKLVEALWDDDPPATATKQVQNCVSAIRERLGTHRFIRTEGPGYRLEIAADQLDSLRFQHQVATARRLTADGNPADGVRELRAALRLWRGPALDGLGTSSLAGRAARLDEQRLSALEECLDWQLDLGEHRAVIDELVELVSEHPLRERPHAQLMRALEGSGRQAEALEVFHQLRGRLAADLGIEPGAEVQAMHERILTRGARLPATTSAADAATAAPVRDDGLDRAVRELASALDRQWTAEAEMRSLNRPEPVPLRWSSTGRPVADALGDNGSERLVLSGDLTDVVAKYRQVPTRRLVVLGEPGAGKSVLAILLTLGLLARAEPDEPLPVLVPVASWNPRKEHLHGWLARKLEEEYPGLANTAAYGRDAALRLILDGRVVPILDGLDETTPGLLAVVIDALDQSVAGGRPLVVTCRSAEYEEAVRQGGTVLANAAVVEIEPVELSDAITFLTSRQRLGETRWEPTVERLRQDPTGPLAQVMRTPLMVDLARTAYANPATDPGELCDAARFPDRVTIEAHLLDAYLPAVYSTRPPPPAQHDRPVAAPRYAPDEAERWLVFLARHLQRLQTRDLAWWQLGRAVPPAVVGLYLGLPPGLVFGLVGWLAAGPTIGLIYGAAFVFAGCVSTAFGSRPVPLRVELQVRGRTVPFLVRFAVGVVIGVCFGLGWSLTPEFIVLLTLVFGAAMALHGWLDRPVDVHMVSSPDTVLRNDRTATIAFMISFFAALSMFFGMAFGFTKETRYLPILGGSVDLALALAGGIASALLGHFLNRRTGTVVYGIAGAVVGGLVFSRSTSVIQAVAVGFVFGIAVVLTVGIHRGWGAFCVHRGWLAARGDVPLQLMRFLADAHKRGVLRQVGAVYQFRHARLQERLATRP